jgi:hypothetical protein
VEGDTSGCVRATALDAHSLKLRTLVVEEAVFDREELPPLAKLLSLDSRSADVLGPDELPLGSVPGPPAPVKSSRNCRS